MDKSFQTSKARWMRDAANDLGQLPSDGE